MEDSEKNKNKEQPKAQPSDSQAKKTAHTDSPAPAGNQINPKAPKKAKFQDLDNKSYHKIQNKFQNKASSRLAFRKKSSKGR